MSYKSYYKASSLSRKSKKNRNTYTSLLDNLNWIPLSQLVMEKRAVLAHRDVNGRRQIPDVFMLKSSLDLRQRARTGHGLELVNPATLLEAAP
uniref:Uncharacterized protein n=1 Tax=Acrobeloides nanus TaxID=290746 RepID=A0A914DPR4_9BILA